MRRLSGLTILVVEDNFHVAELLRDVMQDAGARVVGPASNVDAALDIIRESGNTLIDGVVLDVNLGAKGDSAQFAKVLRCRGLPFVVVSGYDERAIPEPMKDAPLVQKPWQEEFLCEAVERAFRPASHRISAAAT